MSKEHIIGNQIKHYRKLRNMRQIDLGNLLALSRASISNIERGNQLPTLKTITLFAKALDVSVSNLFEINPQKRLADTLINMGFSKISEVHFMHIEYGSILLPNDFTEKDIANAIFKLGIKHNQKAVKAAFGII